MQHEVAFTKASGAGNDFVLLDNMKGSLQFSFPMAARVLCSRPYGIGADGLLVLEHSSRAAFSMKYYNADGSYGGMCGNGGRCIARYAFLKGYAPAAHEFEALGHVYRAEVVGSRVRLRMKPPHDLRPTEMLEVSGASIPCGFVNTGSPHAVVFVSSVEDVDVDTLGRAIRLHTRFAPEGANVNFVQRLGNDRIRIRTYERGVEAETFACGTGSVASAVIFRRDLGFTGLVHIEVRSGEELVVDFEEPAVVSGTQAFPTAFLEGSAHIVFQGTVLIDDISCTISPIDA